MAFCDEEKAKSFLRRVNYYRFCIYANSLTNTKDNFSGLSFEQVESFYILDRKLRSVLMSALSWAEVSFRTSFAYHVSLATNDPFFYLDSANFRNPYFHTQSLGEIEKDFKNDSTLAVFGQDTLGNDIYVAPPAWKMVEITTFGRISKLFCNLKKIAWIDKVARQFGFDKTEIKSVIKSIADLRNKCAHHRKILFSNFNSVPALTADMSALGINNNSIGGFIFVLYKMMKTEPNVQKSFIDDIKNIYQQCPPTIKANFEAVVF